MTGVSQAARTASEQVGYTFAPWVAELGLELTETSASRARLRLPADERVTLRGGPGVGVTCGQAIAAVADTACVYALTGANGRFRNCATVDMSVRFIRPLTGAADVTVDIESNGRKLAVCLVSVRPEGSEKAAALATATFLYLEE
ncbi:MAG: PaaI family thioesterase [Rhodobacteraceae bacterium]|nr:PaaI family thioesterase [Paracoccaceae bacterium]